MRLLSSILAPVLVVALFVLMGGCTRNRPSTEPPIHLNPNMDNQPRYNAQSESFFFEDGATMRPLVPGTVPRGWLKEDVVYYTGKDGNGNLVVSNPVAVDIGLLKRGQQRFDIFCAPCHSRVGDGKGIMIQRGYLPPPSFHDERIKNLPDGHFFDAISNGIRNMPSYRSQVPVHDRWAIVAYIRALQRSQDASVEDVPVELRETVR